MINQNIENKKGQALLIVLLAMAALTTITLSIVSRSISQVEITNREEESIRAFSAAEAGLEQALVNSTFGEVTQGELEVDTEQNSTSIIGSFDSEIRSYPENATQFAYPIELAAGESGTFWFVAMDGNEQLLPCGTNNCYSGTTIDLCWGNNPQNNSPISGTTSPTNIVPAVSLSFVFDKGGVLYTAKGNIDPVLSRRSSNDFIEPNSTNSCTIDGVNYGIRHTLNIENNITNGYGVGPGGLKYMQVQLLYNTDLDQTFGVTGSAIIPPQGKVVTSTGTSGNATRKIEAYMLNPTAPTIFNSAIYSPNSIIK